MCMCACICVCVGGMCVWIRESPMSWLSDLPSQEKLDLEDVLNIKVGWSTPFRQQMNGLGAMQTSRTLGITRHGLLLRPRKGKAAVPRCSANWIRTTHHSFSTDISEKLSRCCFLWYVQLTKATDLKHEAQGKSQVWWSPLTHTQLQQEYKNIAWFLKISISLKEKNKNKWMNI